MVGSRVLAKPEEAAAEVTKRGSKVNVILPSVLIKGVRRSDVPVSVRSATLVAVVAIFCVEAVVAWLPMASFVVILINAA